MTGEDLGFKPGVVAPTKFVYSSLGKAFNNGLDEDKKQLENRTGENIENSN